MIDKNFMGMNGFVWWMGVVEDRKDPLKLGRCRVRIFGWHSENKAELPTSALPWSQAMLPLNNTNAYSPKESDTVVGFFMDGEDAQHPVMMGVLPSIPMEKGNPNIAFNDPRTDAQLNTSPVKFGDEPTNYPRKIDEPTTSRLARGDSEFTPEQITQLSGSKLLFEQDPSYNTRYPYNKVIETEGGNALELDDTPGFERVHLYHSKGSNLEMRPEGTVQQKVVNNYVKNVAKDDINYIGGNCVYYIDGDLTYVVGGKVNIIAELDITAVSQQRGISLSAKSNFSASASLMASVGGKVSSSLGGSSLFTSVSGLKTDVTALSTLTCRGTGAALFGSGGSTTVNGAVINLVNVATPGNKSGDSKTATDGTTATTPTTSSGTATSTSSVTDSTTVVDGFDPQKAIKTYEFPVEKTSSLQGSITQTDVLTKSLNGTTVLNTDALSLADKASIAASDTYTQAKEMILNAPTKVAEQLNIKELDLAKDNLVKASFNLSKVQNLDNLTAVTKAAGDVAGLAAKTLTNVQQFNGIEAITSDYTQNICAVDAVRNETKRVYRELKDKGSEIVNSIKDDREKLREKMNNITQEYKNLLRGLDEKGLQEWIDTHRYDESCALCAQEAEVRLQGGAQPSDVKKALADCINKEADAYLAQLKTALPITDSTLVKVEKDICGNPEIKIDVGR